MFANHQLLAEKIQSLSKNYDELPYIQADKDSLDWVYINNVFAKVNKEITEEKAENLGILVRHIDKLFPSIGGMILFGKNRLSSYPDAIIRCARFLGTTRVDILDQKNFSEPFFEAIDHALQFIERHTSVRAEIKRLQRTDIPDYPPIALRETLINAVVHADYSIRGSTITIAIYDDRIEFANPGGLAPGLTLENALAGSSKIRNRVIAKVFHALSYIEQWGTGFKKILSAAEQRGLAQPKIADMGTYFVVTLYKIKAHPSITYPWQQQLIDHLKIHEDVSTKQAAELWDTSERTARTRLKQLADNGFIKRIATAKKDPFARYVLIVHQN